MTLNCINTGGRGRYRTADRWCVKGQDRVTGVLRCPACPGQRHRPCPSEGAVSTVFGPVLGHWRVTGERVCQEMPPVVVPVVVRPAAAIVVRLLGAPRKA
jgi:hypothetical protein